MSYLGISHLPIRQADITATGFERGVWAGRHQAIKCWGIGKYRCIIRAFRPKAPAIKDAQNNRFRGRHMLEFSAFPRVLGPGRERGNCKGIHKQGNRVK